MWGQYYIKIEKSIFLPLKTRKAREIQKLHLVQAKQREHFFPTTHLHKKS